MNMKRTVTGVICAIALGLSLAACSPADSNFNDTNTQSPAVTKQPAATGKTKPSNPGKGIIRSTKMTSCDTKAGPVVAEGTVSLLEETDGVVKISVSWVDPTTSKVLGKGEQLLPDLEISKSKKWKISTKLSDTPKDVTCVLGATVLPAKEK